MWTPISPMPAGRPYVMLNAAMSIDGKVCTRGGDSHFSDEEDWRQVHCIRASVDALMVDVHTILKDNPSLRVKYYPVTTQLTRVVVDSTGRTPLDARVLQVDPQHYQTILCVTNRIEKSRKQALEERGARVIVVNAGAELDVLRMLQILQQQGIHTILLEGGGRLNWSMLAAKVIDEIRLFLAPVCVGGQDAIGLVGGAGFDQVPDAPSFKLHRVESRGNFIILQYVR